MVHYRIPRFGRGALYDVMRCFYLRKFMVQQWYGVWDGMGWDGTVWFGVVCLIWCFWYFGGVHIHRHITLVILITVLLCTRY